MTVCKGGEGGGEPSPPQTSERNKKIEEKSNKKIKENGKKLKIEGPDLIINDRAEIFFTRQHPPPPS